ncbi:MAG: succinate--CoA ligase subunit beta, partial [Candidatus Dojkabacteria bacterium]
LYKLFVETNCMLVEINPLVVDSREQLMALDGKIDVDDNALYKHPDILAFRDEITDNLFILEARKFDFLYIPLEDRGDIAVISNGSGMIMSSIDLISKRGMTVTCALDLGGGATAERVREALKIVASNPNVKTIFINIFGGITRCDEIAGGISTAMKDLGSMALVVRLEGTNKEKGLSIIKNTTGNIEMADGLSEGVDVLARKVTI